ncbi:MAG: hypothetical protein PWP04_1057 [Candidatus Atribacteria bacterium]|nr:hypothetical protein [Candidatus Atribacteria bacterium]
MTEGYCIDKKERGYYGVYPLLPFTRGKEFPSCTEEDVFSSSVVFIFLSLSLGGYKGGEAPITEEDVFSSSVVFIFLSLSLGGYKGGEASIIVLFY